MALITIKVGGTAGAAGRDQPATLAGLQAAYAAIPADVVASGNSYLIELYNDTEFVLSGKLQFDPKTTDASHTIAMRPAVGHSFADNPNVLTNAYFYNQANGVAFRCTTSFNDAVVLNCPNLTLWGIQATRTGTGGGNVLVAINGSVIDNCIADVPTSGGVSIRGIYSDNATLRNNLVTMSGALSAGVYFGNGVSVCENNTVVRRSSFTDGGGYAFSGDNSNTPIVNCAGFGTPFAGRVFSSGKNNASDGAIAFGTASKPNLAYASQFVNTDSDFRLKAGSALIDAGATPSAGNTLAPGGNRQQGTSADIGAWEYPNVVQAPAATITAITITGTTVKIDGTFTGGITSGFATLTKTAVTGNNAVDKPQQNLTIDSGAGTFTVSFTGCRIGRYDVVAKVSNASYTNVQAANALGGANVTGPLALSVVQDPIDGQVYTLHGTCTNAVSGNLTIPPAALSPNGAAQQSLALTINTGVTPNTYTVTATLAAGNYDPGILTFTNTDGTSLPQAGTAAVTVMGFTGNPEAPPGDGSNPAATVTSVAVSPATATGSTTFTAAVTGTNSPSQAVTWTTTGGNVTGGVFTAPAATGSVQTITVTATSIADPSKSGAATVTIAAAAPASVSSVTVTPATSVLATNTTVQFAAQVNGTGSPSQAVTWSKTGAGSIDAAGLFTRPAQTNAIQTITITATSVVDSSKSGSATVTILALPVTNERLDMAKLDATHFINLMPIGQSGKRSLTTLINSLIGDIKQLRDAQTIMAAKLDADAGVTDTNYSAVATVPDANVILGK